MTTQNRTTDSIERILAAARHEFTEHGFSGARVDAIAARAGVNKALLYYHVGGKAALYERVLHDTLGNAAESLADIVSTLSDPVDKLKTYVRSLLGTIRENPQIPSIIMQELAGGARHLPEQVARDFACMFDVISGVLEEGVRAGVFRNTAPVLIHFMVVGPAIFHPRVSALRNRFDDLAEALHLEKNFDISLEAEIERLVMRAVTI
jgi:AcrR family transcriptional regulator